MLHFYFAIAWLVLPALIFLVCLCINRRIHFVWSAILCVASMFTGTYLLMQSVLALDALLLAEIGKHEPGSPEAARASEAWASDTSRSFTFVLSPVLTGVWYTGLFGLLFGSRWALSKHASTKVGLTRASLDNGSPTVHKDDGNPYQPPSTG